MDVFDLVAKLTLDSSQYDSGLDDGEQKARGFGSKLTSVLGGAAKIGGAALGAASAAAVALTKSAISSYASYEQLVGGVDKLYGDASARLQSYAEQAYLTAGMSANQYMETATSFSASLINSLGGDTKKAADMTDVAMRAMSDNVNVFGSSMDSVQNAFQGFAKGNYTMLDNLKLGYGGTKTEMERLIADANEYRASIGETADLSIDSFADVVQAIQSVQEAQGIAGTTNKEAMKTIEGSAAATKAAWENVITAIGRGEGLGDAVSGLANAIFGEGEGEGLLNQIIPRIQTTLEGISDFILTVGPMIAKKVPEIAGAVIPSLVSTAVNIVGVLGEALPGLITELATGVGEIIVETAPLLIEVFQEVMDSLITFISETLPQFLDKGAEFITNLSNGLEGNLPAIIGSITTVLSNLVARIMQAMPQLLTSGVNLIMALARGIVQNIPAIISGIAQGLVQMLATVAQNYPKLLQTGLELMAKMAAGIIQGAPKIIAKIPKILMDVAKKFTSYNWGGIGSQIMQGVANGIRNGASNIVNAAKNAAKSAFEAAKNFLGIKSPSKLFRDKIGKMMAKGMELGFEDEFDPDDYENAISDIASIGRDYSADVNNSTVTIDRNGDNDEIINAINTLRAALYSMQIVMDSGELVGAIADPMNSALGRKAVIAGRS